MALGWLWWRAWARFGRRCGTLRGRRGTWRHPPWFHVAGVALGGIHLGFAWQAWHLATSTFVSPGRSGTWSHPPSFCVAGVALGDIHLRFAWQNWDLVTATCVLRGRRHPAQPLCHIHLSHTIFVRHCLSHTTLSHTILHPQLCHTPSFTRNFLTHHL